MVERAGAQAFMASCIHWGSVPQLVRGSGDSIGRAEGTGVVTPRVKPRSNIKGPGRLLKTDPAESAVPSRARVIQPVISGSNTPQTKQPAIKGPQAKLVGWFSVIS